MRYLIIIIILSYAIVPAYSEENLNLNNEIESFKNKFLFVYMAGNEESEAYCIKNAKYVKIGNKTYLSGITVKWYKRCWDFDKKVLLNEDYIQSIRIYGALKDLVKEE